MYKIPAEFEETLVQKTQKKLIEEIETIKEIKKVLKKNGLEKLNSCNIAELLIYYPQLENFLREQNLLKKINMVDLKWLTEYRPILGFKLKEEFFRKTKK